MRIAHISDPHFGTTTPEKIGALTETLRELKPDLILLSGDVTQRARKDQFQEARNFCQGLKPMDVMAVPGNHDIPLFNFPARAFWPYFGFRKHFGFPTGSHRAFDRIEILGINTTHPTRHIQGKLTRAGQKKFRLFTSNSLVRIAMFHHPMDCAQSRDEKNLLMDAQESLSTLEEAKVDLVLGGHIHDPISRLSKARYPQAKRPLVIALAGTCLSSRTRSGAPNSFNHIDISVEGENVRLETVRYDMSQDLKFSPIMGTRYLRRGRDLWETDTGLPSQEA